MERSNKEIREKVETILEGEETILITFTMPLSISKQGFYRQVTNYLINHFLTTNFFLADWTWVHDSAHLKGRLASGSGSNLNLDFLPIYFITNGLLTLN